jgi:hypothetical protein
LVTLSIYTRGVSRSGFLAAVVLLLLLLAAAPNALADESFSASVQGSLVVPAQSCQVTGMETASCTASETLTGPQGGSLSGMLDSEGVGNICGTQDYLIVAGSGTYTGGGGTLELSMPQSDTNPSYFGEPTPAQMCPDGAPYKYLFTWTITGGTGSYACANAGSLVESGTTDFNPNAAFGAGTYSYDGSIAGTVEGCPVGTTTTPSVSGTVEALNSTGQGGISVSALNLAGGGSTGTVSGPGGVYSLQLPVGVWYVFTTWAAFAPGQPDPFPPTGCPPAPALTAGEQAQLTSDNQQLNLGCVVQITAGGADQTIDFHEMLKQATAGGPTPATWLALSEAPWLAAAGIMPDNTTSVTATATATTTTSDTGSGGGSGAACQAPGGAADLTALAARASKPMKAQKVVLTITRKHPKAGLLKLVFRFKRKALTRAFGTAKLVKVTVKLTIHQPHGRTIVQTTVFVFPLHAAKRASARDDGEIASETVTMPGRIRRANPLGVRAGAVAVTAQSPPPLQIQYATGPVQANCYGMIVVNLQDTTQGTTHQVTGAFSWAGMYSGCPMGQPPGSFSVSGPIQVASFQSGYYTFSVLPSLAGGAAVNLIGFGGGKQFILVTGRVADPYTACTTQLPAISGPNGSGAYAGGVPLGLVFSSG